MLSIKKKGSQTDFTLNFREKDRFFEPRLLTALLFALLFHLAGLLLFPIIPFYLSSTYTFPPIQARFELPRQMTSVLSTPVIEYDEDIVPPIPNMIPSLENLGLYTPSFIIPEYKADPYAFKELEERYWPFWKIPLNISLEESKIQLFISGDLASLPLTSQDPLLNELKTFTPPAHPLSISYSVKLNENTSTLFWIERIESSLQPEIDQLTEKIVQNLRFSPSTEPLEGIINFSIMR